MTSTRYFYTKQPGRIILDAYEHTGEYEIPDLMDERIVTGSIEPFTRYTGWLVLDEVPDELPDDGPVQPAPQLPLEGM